MRRGFGESCSRKCRGRISAQPRVTPGPVIWRLSHQASLPANTRQDGCLSRPLRSPIPGTVSAVGQGGCSMDGAEACWVSKAGPGWSGGRLWDGGAMAWPRAWTVAAGVVPALRSHPRGQRRLGHREPSWDSRSGERVAGMRGHQASPPRVGRPAVEGPSLLAPAAVEQLRPLSQAWFQQRCQPQPVAWGGEARPTQ